MRCLASPRISGLVRKEGRKRPRTEGRDTKRKAVCHVFVVFRVPVADLPAGNVGRGRLRGAMASQPLGTFYTPRELACGGYVAAGLWVLSATLLALLAAWSTGPV